tara:strand:+ start:1701 stop:2492 length:792 start_codon:yes stop_codon:yes gene_type:complete
MSDTKYQAALNKYYTLKRQYDDKYNAAKNKLLKNPTLSIADKRKKLAQIKRKCVICGNVGGTIFSDKGGILSAVCGNASEPCDLNLKIVRAQFMPSYEVINKFSQDINKTKAEVISKKYEMLFGYSNEDSALKEFQKLKKDLSSETVIYEAAMDKYIEATGSLSHKEQIRIKELERYNQIQNIRKLLQEYSKDGERAQLLQLVDIYQNGLMPLVKEIRELKYAYVGVEYDEETDSNLLIEDVFTPQSIEFELKKGKVESGKAH